MFWVGCLFLLFSFGGWCGSELDEGELIERWELDGEFSFFDEACGEVGDLEVLIGAVLRADLFGGDTGGEVGVVGKALATVVDG